jgi:hypothetical protein
MGHAPDHSPAAAAAEHAAVIVALDAGDLTGSERDRAARLAAACAGCAALLADLALIRAATAALPAPRRTRDYRLTGADAARLRPSAWRRLLGWLGAPRSTVRPLAGALATLGIVGLLLGTTPGLFGQATTVSTGSLPAVAPGVAPGVAGGTSGAVAGSAPVDLAPSLVSGPSAAAGFAGASPLASSGAGGVPATPGIATLPAPSPAAIAVPAESPAAMAVPAPSPARGNVALPAPAPPGSGVVTGSAAAEPPSPSAPAPAQGASKATASEGPEVARNAPAQSGSPLAATDRTPLVAASLVLLLAGLVLYAANRMLRRRAGA